MGGEWVGVDGGEWTFSIGGWRYIWQGGGEWG